MFKFFSKNSVDEAVNCAYLATKMLEFKGKIEIGEEDEKVESLAEKMIAEIVEVEGTSLENFSDEAIRRYIRIVSEWVDATIFTKELTLSDLRKGEEIVNLWLESEVSDRNEAKAENERLKEVATMEGYLEGIKRERDLLFHGLSSRVAGMRSEPFSYGYGGYARRIPVWQGHTSDIATVIERFSALERERMYRERF